MVCNTLLLPMTKYRTETANGIIEVQMVMEQSLNPEIPKILFGKVTDTSTLI